MSQLIFLIIGLAIGFWLGKNSKSARQNKKPVPSRLRQLTAIQRQKAKVLYATDADRIRELNLLSPTEGKFLRLLQHEFINTDIVVKQKRFFVVDKDQFPLAIFEYRDGLQTLRATDVDDGLPVFLYKNLPPSSSIKEDAEFILIR